MIKDVIDFFVEKKEWSEIKDALLACYLTPYFSKILNTQKTVNYIDCFSGKGKFDDGKPCSPIIALDIITECMKHKNSFSCPLVNTYFIEKNYAKELDINLQNYKTYRNVEIIDGTYQEKIKGILQSKQKENVFLYIDPFGIKCLDFDLYDFYSKSNFSSIELLINFNSFGFIREACRIKKLESVYITKLDIIIKFFGEITDTIKSEQELNNIAGGNYWETIIEDYKLKKITCYEAEKILSKQYCNKLREKFKYVVNMPIRLKSGQQPKYRMIHVTNNEEGCLLMVQNICKRWENLFAMQTRNSEPSLFEENIENDIIDEKSTENIILNHLNKYSDPVHMNIFLSELFTDAGVFTKWDMLQKVLRNLEKNGKINVKRDPAITKTGKVSTFINESSKENHSVEIWINK